MCAMRQNLQWLHLFHITLSQGRYYFPQFMGEETEAACQGDLGVSDGAGLWNTDSLAPRAVSVHPGANHTLGKWKAMTSGTKAGVQGWKGTVASAVLGLRTVAALTVTLTCGRPRHWLHLAEQAWSLSPQMLLQFFSWGRRFDSLGHLML